MDKKGITEFFDKCSRFWDENMITDDEKMATILDYAEVGENDSVLDVACGTGVMFNYYLGRNVSHITGIDISNEMIKICKSKFNDNEKIDVFCADADTVELNAEFDRVVVFNALPHFISPERLIENLCRAVKKGGTLTVAHDRGRKALNKHHEGAASPYSRELISEKELGKIFEKNGLSSIKALATEEIYIVTATK